MMDIGILTDDEIQFLEHHLKLNTGMTEDEISTLKKNHPYIFIQEDTLGIIISNNKLYGQHDQDLNQFFLNRFGKEDYSIDFFYELIYNPGQYAKPHFDKKFVIQTTLILLSEDFTGGQLYINNNDVHFNKKNMYINFCGSKDRHSVSKVENGQRRVLVIMFYKKDNLL